LSTFKGYVVTAPDGKTYDVNAPEGTSEEELYSYVEETYYPTTAVAGETNKSPALIGNTDQQLRSRSIEEVPGARDFLNESFFGEAQPSFDATRDAFNKDPRFKGVQLPEDAAQAWAENKAFAQTPSGRAYFMQGNSPFDPVNRSTGVADPEAPDSMGEEFAAAAKRSATGMANSIGVGGAALAAELVGATDTADYLLDSYLANQAANNFSNPTSAKKFKDVRTLGDAGMLAANILGELTPQMASSFGIGMLGSNAGKLIAQRSVAGMTDDLVTQGFTREVAEQMALKAVQKKAYIGATSATTAQSVAQSSGSVFGDTYGETGQKKPWQALFAGTAAGALDSILPAYVFKKVGIGNDIAEAAIVQSLFKKVGKEAASAFLMEGGTEALQTIIENLPAGKSINWDEVVEAGLRGAAGGSVIGGAAGGYEGYRQNKAVAAAAPPAPDAVFTGDPISVLKKGTKRNGAPYQKQLLKIQDDVANRINQLTETWTNAPQFEVYKDFKELEDVPNDAVGVYRDGKVILSTESILAQAKARNVSADNIVAAVTYHEALGHYGLEQQFGEAIDGVLSTILQGSSIYRKRAQDWIAKNPDTYKGDPNLDIRALEEILAERSEKGQLPATFVNQFKNKIKDLGRSMGLNIEYSTREVETILGMAHAAVAGGTNRSVRDNGFRFMTVYHGSPYNFDKFDNSKMSTGEGQQVYGWGTYLTDKQRIAEGYRDRLSAKINTDTNNKGKLYTVELPDDANWLLWDEPLSEQPEVKKLIKDAGAPILDANEWEAAWAEIDEANLLVNALDGKLMQTDETTPEYTALVKEYNDAVNVSFELQTKLDEAISETMSGQDVYQQLARYFGQNDFNKGPKIASEFLNEAGIAGNKYLDGMSRSKGAGSYNYVVFADSTPKIVNKYMMLSSPDKVEYTQEEIDAMTPEELFESKNALNILEGMTKGYTPIVMSYEALKEEAEARGLSPDRVLRNGGIGAGKIVERLYMYDIAMTKMNDHLSNLWEKLQSDDFTAKDKDDYLKSVLKRDELAGRIFEDQGEVARALAAMKGIQYTRRRVKGMQETLLQFKEGSPYEALNDPEAFYKFAMDVQNQITDSRAKLQAKGMEMVGQALNLPRSLMSSMDLSAPLRQGIFLIHKGAWWKSFFNMFRYAGDQKAFDDLMESITANPMYGEMVKSKLALSNLSDSMTQREEAFMSNWAEKIPVVGKFVKGSERAYVGFLNKLRSDVFTQLVSKLPEGYSPQDAKDIAAFVNAATGRGNMPEIIDRAAPLLNAILFSPRLMASRIKMTTVLVDPRTYLTMNKTARAEYVKSIIAVGSLALLVNSLAAAGGAETEEDPRSSSFGKIKIGNTRYDILGGEGQYVVLAARVLSGTYKTSEGDIKPYGNKVGQTTRRDAVDQTLFYNKLAPIPGFVSQYLEGADPVGNKFEADKALMNLFIPLYMQDMQENIERDGLPTGVAKSIPALFGIGVQTFEPAALNTDKVIEAPDSFEMGTAADGKYPNATVEDGVVTLDEKAKLEWGNRINFYFKEWMKEEMLDKSWKTKTDKEKREIISEVRNDARKEAKLDMVELLEIKEYEEDQ
jgi:hypothetical protein